MFRQRLPVTLLGLSACLLSACVDEPELSSNLETFEEFRDRTPRLTELAEDAYLIEGDTRIHGDDALYEYWKAHRQDGALVVARRNGADRLWNTTDRLNLTYCVGDFGAAGTPRIIAAMNSAAAEWEARANVNFIHVTSQDGAACTNTNYNVKFNVQMVFSGPAGSMVGPYEPREASVLAIHAGSLGNDAVGLITLLGHELGHALGFPHEHGTPTGPCPEYLEGDYRWVTPYDVESIMHYGGGCGGRSPRWWSRLDRVGATSLYGPGFRGYADILWRQASTNAMSIWLMNGATPVGYGGSAVAAGWGIVGTGDVNRDRKDDIVWQHTNGTVSVWLMNGTSYIGGFGWQNSSAWSVIAVADLDGDDRSEIILRNGSQLRVWFLGGNGSTITTVATPSIAPPSHGLIGVGDFDRNGTSDLLWGPSSAPQVWLMNGSNVIATGVPAVDSGPSVVKGVGDFNADGRDDILRHNPSTNALSIWFLDGTTRIATGTPPVVSGGWNIEGVADFNGDWKADILWRHTSGTTGMWFMDGSTHVGDGVPPGPVSSDWQVRGTPRFD